MAQRNLTLGERLAVLDERYEQLATQARQREENVSDAVHDLRQPMHALRLSLRERFLRGSQSADSGHIEAALTYMEQLVADRLAERSDRQIAARANNATARPAAQAGVEHARTGSPEPGLHDVLRGVAEMFAPEAAAKGLELTLRLAAPDASVQADPLMRATANLVSNTIKSTRQGRVVLALRRRGDGLRIEVHDT